MNSPLMGEILIGFSVRVEGDEIGFDRQLAAHHMAQQLIKVIGARAAAFNLDPRAGRHE